MVLRNRYKILDERSRPFIFAFSALINDRVIAQINTAGFDGYVENKLTKVELEEIIQDYIDTYINIQIEQKLQDFEKAKKIMQLIE